MLLSTLAIIIVVQFVMGENLSPAYSLIAGIIITGLEQLSIYGIDNITVPIATAALTSIN